MSNNILQKIVCPSCQSPIDLQSQSTDGAQIRCEACGSEFLIRGHVCPYCGTYHENEAAFCRQCGSGLTRRCHQCDTINWIGDEFCVKCGGALDILEIIVQRHKMGTSGRLQQQMDSAKEIKESEAAAAQARMSRMLNQERERQAEIREQLKIRKEQEKKMLNFLYVFIGIVAIVIILSMFL